MIDWCLENKSKNQKGSSNFKSDGISTKTCDEGFTGFIHYECTVTLGSYWELDWTSHGMYHKAGETEVAKNKIRLIGNFGSLLVAPRLGFLSTVLLGYQISVRP